MVVIYIVCFLGELSYISLTCSVFLSKVHLCNQLWKSNEGNHLIIYTFSDCLVGELSTLFISVYRPDQQYFESGVTCKDMDLRLGTVDGRNPAPVDMVNIRSLIYIVYTSQVVQDFFHQQYGCTPVN